MSEETLKLEKKGWLAYLEKAKKDFDCNAAYNKAQPEQKSVAMADYIALTEKYVALKAAQRTWVGLTKEEFIYFSSCCHFEVVDEIEKLLQRKNT
jgi:uncharacterized protein YecT (DUF1311 family)